MIRELKELVRRQRAARGLTQAELARLAGVGKTVVFDLEHGKQTMQLDTVTKILDALEIRFSFWVDSHSDVQDQAVPAGEADEVPVHLL
jgi:HTH-type transcriptional regulator / antitoxin HipB